MTKLLDLYVLSESEDHDQMGRAGLRAACERAVYFSFKLWGLDASERCMLDSRKLVEALKDFEFDEYVWHAVKNDGLVENEKGVVIQAIWDHPRIDRKVYPVYVTWMSGFGWVGHAFTHSQLMRWPTNSERPISLHIED